MGSVALHLSHVITNTQSRAPDQGLYIFMLQNYTQYRRVQIPCQITRATTCSMVVPNICESPVWHLLHVTKPT